jgi:hypothetical protein
VKKDVCVACNDEDCDIIDLSKSFNEKAGVLKKEIDDFRESMAY